MAGLKQIATPPFFPNIFETAEICRKHLEANDTSTKAAVYLIHNLASIGEIDRAMQLTHSIEDDFEALAIRNGVVDHLVSTDKVNQAIDFANRIASRPEKADTFGMMARQLFDKTRYERKDIDRNTKLIIIKDSYLKLGQIYAAISRAKELPDSIEKALALEAIAGKLYSL